MPKTRAIQRRENEPKTVAPGDDRACTGQCPECESGGFEHGAVWCEFVCDECGLVVTGREMESLSDEWSVGKRAEPTSWTAECGERVEG